ncbi:hypothetical protein BDV96DRAFT_587291 [Lophiotrema nucula]|uniref:Uncharacterized protein n=1 Tax=Lophiotrema nucula TaxID=690887 RepID=A0A6A5YQ14_9PLEO|nr:hypothetical protein BDV96DRAFT_587291 [Lophiotrema nucula]
MRASIFISAPIFAAAALAQSESSSSVDAFPQTSYLQQTDSRGVVTGMPAVATSIPSQPAAASSIANLPPAVTTQPLPASIPAVGTGLHTIIIGGPSNTTQTLVVSANNSTTIIVPTASSASSGASGAQTTGGASGSGPSGSATGSATGAQSTGAAPTMAALAGSFVGLGAFVAAFL